MFEGSPFGYLSACDVEAYDVEAYGVLACLRGVSRRTFLLCVRCRRY